MYEKKSKNWMLRMRCRREGQAEEKRIKRGFKNRGREKEGIEDRKEKGEDVVMKYKCRRGKIEEKETRKVEIID